MFKAILNKFKRKSGLKFLKEELSKPFPEIKKQKGIASIACIVNLDNYENVDKFYELIDEFSLKSNAIKIIGYKRQYDKNSPYSTPVFSDKDLGWNGKIENSYVLEFLSKEYDLLLNYYTEDRLMLQLMSIKTRARIRVGFIDIDKKYNDLILASPIGDFKLFKLELKKYLKVFKEID